MAGDLCRAEVHICRFGSKSFYHHNFTKKWLAPRARSVHLGGGGKNPLHIQFIIFFFLLHIHCIPCEELKPNKSQVKQTPGSKREGGKKTKKPQCYFIIVIILQVAVWWTQRHASSSLPAATNYSAKVQCQKKKEACQWHNSLQRFLKWTSCSSYGQM